MRVCPVRQGFALLRASATPQICNSDQRSHFTSPQYTQWLLAANVQISMDGRGPALDNICTERLWRTVKYEEVYRHDYANPREARCNLSAYLAFYNYERPHQALNYLTPAQVYYGQEAARLVSTHTTVDAEHSSAVAWMPLPKPPSISIPNKRASLT